MHNFIQIIKKAAVEAVEASNPARVMYGTVLTDSPLKIKIDQKFILTKEFLILTKNVKDYETEATVNWTTESESGHNHGITGRKKIIIHNALKVGDKVMLLQEQGGQKYIVLDKVGD